MVFDARFVLSLLDCVDCPGQKLTIVDSLIYQQRHFIENGQEDLSTKKLRLPVPPSEMLFGSQWEHGTGRIFTRSVP